jgi:hypothetical protein
MKHPFYFREAASLLAFGGVDVGSIAHEPCFDPKKKGL